jgi:lipoprotein signal peptidase
MDLAAAPCTLAPPRAGIATRQGWLLLAVLGTIGGADQLSKAWAWRHLTLVHINSGGGLLFGRHVDAWTRDRLLGSAVDALAGAVVVALAALLVRRRRPWWSFLGAAAVLGGWASNLADRVGLHAWTAPGSRRGVVDFLHWQGRLWNVADLAIIAGCALFLAGGAHAELRRLLGRGARRQPLPPAL